MQVILTGRVYETGEGWSAVLCDDCWSARRAGGAAGHLRIVAPLEDADVCDDCDLVVLPERAE